MEYKIYNNINITGNKLIKLNKKLWSFNIGCLITASFIGLVGASDVMPIPELLLSYTWFDITLFHILFIALISLAITTSLVMVMHYAMRIHSTEHTFWLVIPILTFLVFISVFANTLILSMLNAAIPSLILIFSFARKKKPRRIFYEKKR